MQETFHDRLEKLINGEKPYAWANKVGIEKGLFQYYWQRKKIPTFKSLIKIQKATGCSLDWLLTGRSVDMRKLIEDDSKNAVASNHSDKLLKSIGKINSIYLSENQEDMLLLEAFLEKFNNS